MLLVSYLCSCVLILQYSYFEKILYVVSFLSTDQPTDIECESSTSTKIFVTVI